ncbi:MAG: right-handed parallel beta-helix repeat-containing protein [Chthonomonadales bacterium]
MFATRLAALLLLTTISAHAQTLYVNPKGSDANTGLSRTTRPGSTHGPLASMDGARMAVAKLRSGGKLTGLVHVKFAPGEYPIRKPIHFGAADSGTKELPVIYEAEQPGPNGTGDEANVVFNAGIPFKNPGFGGPGVWAYRIPADMPYFDQVYVDGKRAVTARSPKKFWYKMTGRYKVDPKNPVSNAPGRAFCVSPDVFKILTDLRPSDLHRTTVVVYHAWEISRHHIESLDESQNGVILAGPGAPWAFMEWGATQRFHLEGIPALTGDDGEWCRSILPQKFNYFPRPGQSKDKADVRVPSCEQALILKGDAEHKVQYLTFKGLAFRNTGFVLPREGHADPQAAVSIPGVLQVDHATFVNFTGCEVAHTGDYGIWFREGCTNCRVERCYLHDLGAGGVRIGEAEIRPVGPGRTGGITVDNNIIHEAGRIFMGSDIIWVGQSGGNHVTHNDLSDAYYTGISSGWTWGYTEALTQNNRYEYNHIHHLGKGVLSDMGGVYTLGNHAGSTVNNNVIHDVYSYDKYGRGGWGLYTDEGTTGIEMANNLVYNVKTGTFHQHYGKDNMIRNNILVNSMDGQLQRSRVEDHLSFTFQNNIVSWMDGGLFAGSWKDKNVALKQNLYWNAGKPITFEGMNFKDWQATGKDEGSQIADPMFVDAAMNDYRLKPNSHALKMGFVPFDPGKAGVYGPAKWKKLAGSFVYPKVEFGP